jgi:glyoxylase-like metal-dependent hydrolase (beta-lactamase superfamily II)
LAGYISPLPELDSGLTQFSLTASDSSNVELEVFYPGPGHTEDNIVVWIPSDGVLFGGCLVKAIENIGLGNTADAFVDRWASTIRGLQTKYADAKIVIPRHGRIGNLDLLKHTIELINARVNEE